MYYNVAVNYLIEKYKNQCHKVHSYAFKKKLSLTINRKDTRFLLDNITEDDWEYVLPRTLETDNHDDLTVFILLGQYYLGIEPKKELKAKLIELNLVESK